MDLTRRQLFRLAVAGAAMAVLPGVSRVLPDLSTLQRVDIYMGEYLAESLWYTKLPAEKDLLAYMVAKYGPDGLLKAA